MLLYYGTFMPMLFLISRIIKNDYLLCCALFAMYISLYIFLNYDIKTTYLSKLGFPLALFFTSLSSREENIYQLNILLFSIITYYCSLTLNNDNRKYYVSINLISHMTTCLTYHLKSQIMGFFSVAFLFLKLVYNGKKSLNLFNDLGLYFSGEELEMNDFNLHLVIWLQLKIYYIMINYLNSLNIFLYGFHFVMGILYTPRVVSGLLDVNVAGNTKFEKTIMFVCLISLVVTHMSFVYRVSILASVFVYTFMYQYDIPIFYSKIISVIDLLFTLLLINNLIY